MFLRVLRVCCRNEGLRVYEDLKGLRVFERVLIYGFDGFEGFKNVVTMDTKVM